MYDKMADDTQKSIRVIEFSGKDEGKHKLPKGLSTTAIARGILDVLRPLDTEPKQDTS
jgi:hypothetical protein